MEKFGFEKKVIMLDGEYWWGGSVGQGIRMPIAFDRNYRYDCTEKCQGNSYSGIFSSNYGRYLATKGGFAVIAEDGVLTLCSDRDITFGETQEKTLKSAYLAAVEKIKVADSVGVPEDLLLCPQYCTWTEMGIHVSQEKIVEYAKSIAKNNYERKLFIIDDGWMRDYGDWRFDPEKFSDPKQMTEILLGLGFKLYLWLVPFVNEGVPDFALLCEKKALVRGADGKPVLKKWWNGESYVLDLTNPFAKSWLKNQLDFYVTEYGVSGFKFDAGDPDYYAYDDVTFLPTTPTEQCVLWSELANEYEYSELRASTRFAGSHVIIRLSDKQRNWSDECGIGTLVPNMIQAGLCGYPYSCADMIGGGIIADFEKPDADRFDFELISRFCECSALMPCMQFSYAYWRRDEKIKALFAKYIGLHTQVKDYLSELILEAKNTVAPILRHLEYEFPHQGFKDTMSAFMLGSRYLVAPVVRQNQTEQTVTLPSGCAWKYGYSGETFEGGQTVTVSAPVGTLPYFEKIS